MTSSSLNRTMTILATLLVLLIHPQQVVAVQDYGGPDPNDGYEPGPPAPTLSDQIMGLFVSPAYASFSPEECQKKFAPGNCTHFVAGIRPDVCSWMRSNFNAFSWAANARKYGGEFGVTVSKVPQVGDIAVWQAGCDGTTPIPSTGQCTKSPVTGNYEGCGHVAHVVSVDRQNNTFRVEEANWRNRSKPDIKINESCMDFIHAPGTSGLSEPVYDGSEPNQLPKNQLSNTDTILLVDTSISMDEYDINGAQKMAAAQKAADNLLEVIASEQQAAGGALSHQVGLVSFSSSASIEHPLSTDTTLIRETVGQLSPSGKTALAAGLQEAFGLLEESRSSNRMIVLLSDGEPTVGLEFDFCFFCNTTEEDVQKYKEEVLEVAKEAKSKNICIHTVGFGDPSAEPFSDAYIDEDFLRQVAAASGCGRYYGAQESIQLANAFIELRHSAMGTLLLQRSGQISQGETLALGSARVPANQSQLMLTVNWPGSQVIPQLIDPSGKPVNDNYPGAVISKGDTVATILVDRPAAGDWQLSVFGQDVPQGVTSYNALISTRAGLNTPQAETSPWLWAGLAAAIVIIGLIAGSSRSAVPASAPYGSGVPRGTQPPAGRSSAHLVGTAGGLAGKRVRIGRGGLVGRGPSCQLVIPDPAVSREHARLYFAQNHWFIQDLGSRSGTFINNQRVQNAPLQEGVSIRLGNSTFTFHER